MTDERKAGRGSAAARRILAAMPEWGHAISQLNAAIAERMGVTLSDLDCLHALNKNGPATASALAHHVHLTSGSISRMLDRLDAAGCIRRVPDPHDRRKTLIEPTPDGLERVASYYEGLAACTLDDLSAFTEEELAVVHRFITLSQTSTTTELTRVRQVGDARGGRGAGPPGTGEGA